MIDGAGHSSKYISISCGCGADHEEGAACSTWSRRGLLRSELWAVTSLSAGVGSTLALPAAAEAQNNISPDEALMRLIDGNKRFTQQQLTSLNDDLKLLKEKTAEAQTPFAALPACRSNSSSTSR
jgi:carbonic anhydrase